MNLDPPEYRKAPPGKVCPRCLESSVYDGECTAPGCVPEDDDMDDEEPSSASCPECGQNWCGCYMR